MASTKSPDHRSVLKLATALALAGACLPACSGGHGNAVDDGGTAAGDAAPPSCSAPGDGLTNGGADGESSCASLAVDGGTYSRTYSVVDAGLTELADPATLSTFRLDKYEVTVGRFRRFVAAWNGGAGFTPPLGSGKHSHLNAGLGLADSGSAGTYEQGWSAAGGKRIAPTDDNLGSCGAYATRTPSP